MDFLSIPQRQRDRMEQNFEVLRNEDDRGYALMRNGVAIGPLNDTIGEVYDEFFKVKDKKTYFEASIQPVEDRDWFYVEGDVYQKYKPIFTHCEEQFHTRRDVLGHVQGWIEPSIVAGGSFRTTDTHILHGWKGTCNVHTLCVML
jgi:hypothetical protein